MGRIGKRSYEEALGVGGQRRIDNIVEVLVNGLPCIATLTHVKKGSISLVLYNK